MLQEQLEKIVRPACEELGLRLVELDVQGGKRNPVINVYADTDDGITLGQCTDLTRRIRDELDLDDILRENYRLNVSSPGLDRPLQEDWEFKKSINKELRVVYSEDEKSLEVTGKLTAFDANKLVIENKGTVTEIPRAQIVRAKIKLQW